MSTPRVPNQRAIINRRVLSDRIASLAQGDKASAGPVILKELRSALETGRTELTRRLTEKPSAGYECVHGHSFLIDQLVRVIHDYITEYVHPAPNRTAAERLAILAVGGYGRAEMAPHSDVDIAFITPMKRAPWCEQVIEAMLYLLWDLGLQVGHSSRTIADSMKICLLYTSPSPRDS